MRIWLLLVTVLPLVVLCGCGGAGAPKGDGSSVRVAAESPGTSLPSAGTLEKYFDGVARATTASFDDAAAAARPGSPAAAYVVYLKAAAQAVLDGGETLANEGASAVVNRGGYEFCDGTGSSRTCYRYTDITGADGRIADFSVNGKPLGDRLTVGDGTPGPGQALGARASFVVAFVSSAGDNLFVVVRLRAGAAALSGVTATYRSSPTGGETASTRMSGAAKLAAGRTGNYAFAFPDARIGGTFTLTVHDAASGTDGTLELPVS